MSLLDWISRAIFGTDARGIYKIGRSLNDAVRPEPEPVKFGMRHGWRTGLDDRCMYCGVKRDATNADAVCPGPSKG